uniref:Uncharacterized protein n=1 Tax=Rubinisphaera brasiliensis (strain ATCC 49424 / DSM 5305 / JCM 21570 / IAM 15109 / NBRC 103401 / IFAM 1448) TaxID=756272 RepID=F0SL84_RUBBR|nr:hypothetical protein Plabr_3370 [Rubinisphaera brasiliensis DSM 5305]
MRPSTTIPQELVVFLASFTARVIYCKNQQLSSDELLALRSAQFISEKKHWPIYRLGQDYMLALDDFISSLLLQVVHNDILAIRLFPILMASIGVALFWRIFRALPNRPYSKYSLLPLVVPSQLIWCYSGGATGTYGTAFCISGLLTLLALQCRSHNVRFYSAIALTGGVAILIWRACIFYGIVALSTCIRAPETLTNAIQLASRKRTTIFFFVLSASSGFGLAYHYLTRPQTFSMAAIDYGLLAIFSSSVAAILYCNRPVAQQTYYSLLPALSISCIWATFSVATSLCFSLWAPVIYPAGKDGLYSVQYSIYHVHDIPFQVLAFFGRPFLLVFTGPSLGIVSATYPPLDVLDYTRGAVVLLLVFISVVVWARGICTPEHEHTIRPDALVVLPAILALIVILPSYQNFGDYSYRYLVPFLPGILLLIDSSLARVLSPALRVSIWGTLMGWNFVQSMPPAG